MRTRLVEQQINLCLPGKIIHLAKAKKGMLECMLLLCAVQGLLQHSAV